MGRIRCGHCGGTHDTVAEVRACALGDHGRPDGDDPRRDEAPPPDDDPEGFAPRPSSPASARGAPGGPGPAGLGRNLVVRPGQPVPEAWAHLPRLRVGTDEAALTELRERWAARRGAVLELDPALGLDDPGAPPEERDDREPWRLDPGFAFPGEELHFLVWSNGFDGRDGPPRSRWIAAALDLGASPASASDGAADVLLPDGRPAVCDGGPVGPLDPAALDLPPDTVVVHRVALEHGHLVALADPDADPGVDGLAPDQVAAVTHPGGAVRVIAPAGSGKTRVLGARATRLVRHWRVPAGAMAVVAYNVRARQELRDRTPAVPPGRIDTLNALGRKILDGDAPFAARRGRRRLLDEREVRGILDRLVRFPRRANTDPAAPWIDALSAARLGLRDPAEVEAEGGGELDGFADVFARYRAVLAEQDAIDFDEQIYGTVELLLREPGVRHATQRACRLLLVDEFQDLTPAHLLLVRLLAAPERAVFGVGDDDQTIYGYAGASPRWLIDYGAFFPGAGAHPLEVNYRCPPAVVQAAATLLSHNRQRVPKVIRPAPGRAPAEGELRTVLAPDTVAATTDAVTAAWRAGTDAADIAVLARVNAALAPVQVALAHGGVPVVPAVDEGYLRRTGVAAALAWLRLATSPDRFGRGDVAATVRRPSRGLSPRVAEWMGEQRDLAGLRRLAGRLQAARDADKVAAYAEDLERLAALAERGDSAAVLRALRDEVGLDAALETLDASKGGLRGSAQGDDLDALVALAHLHPDPSTFGAWLRDVLAAPAAPGGVTLATVHSVKGQEWPVVVVHEASAGLLPHRLSDDVEEERRVFHVALTRAAREAVVVAPAAAPSPFLAELHTAADPNRPADPPSRPRPAPPGGRAAKGAKDQAGKAPPTALGEALRAWRRQRAANDGVPPYVVFHDSTLDAIAAARPASLVALGRIKGIGPAKLARYGADVLEVVAASR